MVEPETCAKPVTYSWDNRERDNCKKSEAGSDQQGFALARYTPPDVDGHQLSGTCAQRLMAVSFDFFIFTGKVYSYNFSYISLIFG